MFNFPLKLISSKELRLNNLLYSKCRQIELSENLSIKVGISSFTQLKGYSLTILIGEQVMKCYFQSSQIQSFLSERLGAVTFDILPTAMKKELIISVIEPYQSNFINIFNERVIIDSIELVSVLKSKTKYSFLSITDNGCTIVLWLKNNPELIFNSFPSETNKVTHYPFIKVSFSVGHTFLILSELKTLGIGDVIFLDSNLLGQDQLIMLVSNKPLWRCSLNESSFTVVNKECEKPMSSDHTDINTLPINLTFEVGEQLISFHELSKMQEQYVFELNTPIENPIKIKANGMAIATGELVKINEQIGVRVLSFTDNKSQMAINKNDNKESLDSKLDSDFDEIDEPSREDFTGENRLMDEQINQHNEMD